MAVVLESNKTKMAKRVIEIFEFFDRNHRKATVMDIVRCYGRPQSSTSELLSSLAQIGLLYRDPRTRSYWPTPRLAVMGHDAQPAPIRDGRLFMFIDDLARSTRCSVALFGMVGTHVQIFHSAGLPGNNPGRLCRGNSEKLSASAAGHLLLSTLPTNQLLPLLRRLNAEAQPEARFNGTEMSERIALCVEHGHITGESGFVPGSLVTATLLPREAEERPHALGFVYAEGAAVDTQALLGTLNRGIAACADEDLHDVLSPPFMKAV